MEKSDYPRGGGRWKRGEEPRSPKENLNRLEYLIREKKYGEIPEEIGACFEKWEKAEIYPALDGGTGERNISYLPERRTCWMIRWKCANTFWTRPFTMERICRNWENIFSGFFYCKKNGERFSPDKIGYAGIL